MTVDEILQVKLGQADAATKVLPDRQRKTETKRLALEEGDNGPMAKQRTKQGQLTLDMVGLMVLHKR